ncbi:SDR family oxidoreductase [Pseudomonas sp. NFR16]|uniref:SDR family oxidoreductase n=1 Tax=Pseudomonas sp. NFR16 TaxID=1566248 RepID=UPI0008B6DD4F|nr:SDR family oxidoreductase [Pseudomonas sp. NFR16]SEI45616.1 NAD(P)-dependent dehydrogenase, short-chain alcohol dehydrogenase family [Pseudomonas sp. NFR16]
MTYSIRNFDDKVVLITGGTSGIGLETARQFVAQGAQVIVTGVTAQRLDEARLELGENALVLTADLRQPESLDAVISEISRRFGRLDVVFANAGAGNASPLEDVTAAQIHEQFGLNFSGAFFTVQKAAPLLSKGGSVILTTSFLNAVGTPGLSILSATKAAVRSLARTLGAELAPRGIRVNAVSPGPISTPFHSKLGLSDSQLKEVAAGIEASVPLGRFGEVGEVAKVVLFLASDQASFITGEEIVVDGGLSQF